LPDTASEYHPPPPAAGAPRLALVFVDGVGLAPAGPDNPLATNPTPALGRLLGGPLVTERVGRTPDGSILSALDASLGVDGLPQSATGQTALFTGVNAAEAVGRHVSAFPGPRLRRLIRRHGLLGRLRGAGHDVTFANAYSRPYLSALGAGAARRSATTCLVQYAGLEFRAEADLAAGRAVSWDITRDLFAARAGATLGRVTAVAAGQHLAALAGCHRFTLFETFLTDLAGHRRPGVTPAEAISRVDGLLDGLIDAAPADLTVLVTSDHGNIEDSTDRLHSRNRVPLLAVGPAAERFAGLRSILEVAPAVAACLDS
jgi:2,3-bisphosphoglycerate-independent phosphoglycerate mutase